MQAPNQEALCYKDRYEEWEQQYACKVVTSTRDSFQDMFDDDNTLAYEPESTAAVILTGGNEEAEAAALEVGPLAHHDSTSSLDTQHRCRGSQRRGYTASVGCLVSQEKANWQLYAGPVGLSPL